MRPVLRVTSVTTARTLQQPLEPGLHRGTAGSCPTRRENRPVEQGSPKVGETREDSNYRFKILQSCSADTARGVCPRRLGQTSTTPGGPAGESSPGPWTELMVTQDGFQKWRWCSGLVDIA